MELANLKIERRPGSIVVLEFEVPADDARASYQSSLKTYAASTRIPGFRKGKAPVNLVETRYHDLIVDDARDELIRKAVNVAITQGDIKDEDVISTPRIESHSDYAPDRSMTMTIRFDVSPACAPKDYMGMKLTLKPAPVDVEEIQEELKRIAEAQSTIMTVERPAQKGDIVMTDFQGYRKDGSVIPHSDGVQRPLELGSNRFIPGFEDKLIGIVAGETRNLELTFPEDYTAEEMRGQDASFKVTVTAVRERKVPAIDDDLARDVNYPDLKSLEADIRAHLGQQSRSHAESELEADLLDRLRAANPLADLPEIMVAEEVSRRKSVFAQSLAQMHMKLEQYYAAAKTDEAGHTKEIERMARDTVHSALILRAIARAEKLSVTTEELSMAIAQTAARNDMSPQVLADQLGKEGRIPHLKFDLLKQKALQFILEKADIDRGEILQPVEATPAADISAE